MCTLKREGEKEHYHCHLPFLIAQPVQISPDHRQLGSTSTLSPRFMFPESSMACRKIYPQRPIIMLQSPYINRPLWYAQLRNLIWIENSIQWNAAPFLNYYHCNHLRRQLNSFAYSESELPACTKSLTQYVLEDLGDHLLMFTMTLIRPCFW